MKKWLRRIKAALGIGAMWALAWFGAGIALLFVVGFGAADVPFPLLFGLLGFMAGVVFSTVLAMQEGRRRFDQMSLKRFAGWGAVGGGLLAGLFGFGAAITANTSVLGDLVFLTPLFAAAGAASAAGSLALARKASDRVLLESGAAADEQELGEAEARELLDRGR